MWPGAPGNVCLCIMMLGAAWTDLRRRKVLNGWLLIWAAVGGWCRGWQFFMDAGVMLLFVFWLFRFRLMGAGDGKLMLLTAGYLGFWEGLAAIWTGLFLGAVWSVWRFFKGGGFRARFSYLFAYFMRIAGGQGITAYEDFSEPDGRHRIPLAACLAAGVYLYLLCRS